MLTFGVHSYGLFSWQYQNESHVINSFVIFWTYIFTREGAQMRHPVIEPFASECSSSVQSKPFRREPSILPPQVRSSKKYWDRVTHICVNELTILGPDNSLSPGRRQAIIWTNAGILLIEPVTKISEILIEIHTFSFKKNAFENVVCEMAPILSRP